MRFQAILNRDGGTLRSLDLDAFSEKLRDTLQSAGHSVEIAIVAGGDIDACLDEACESDRDVVMVGGGDGTISAAASKLSGTGKALAVLPAGTMNLFARSLGVPLDLEQALAAFAEGVVQDVDLASANGKMFVHQFSVGLHAEMIRLREERDYGSRLGKIWASLRAAVDAFVRPPRFHARLVIDGTAVTVRTSSVGVTNNLFGEGHLPYADTLTDGVLGVYVTRAALRRDMVKAALRIALGHWRRNPHIDIRTAKEVKLTLLSDHRKLGCAIDGELIPVEKETALQVHPAALRVLVPAAER